MFICQNCRRANDPANDECVKCGESFSHIPACVLTEDCKQANPLFDKDRYAASRRSGDVYDVPPDRIVPAGTVVRHRQAWIHCTTGTLNSPPRAVPLNDACRQRVTDWDAGKEERCRAYIDASLQNPPEEDDARRWLKKLAMAYDRYNGELDDVPLFDEDEEWDE